MAFYAVFIALGIVWAVHLGSREARERRRRRYPPYHQRWRLEDE